MTDENVEALHKRIAELEAENLRLRQNQQIKVETAGSPKTLSRSGDHYSLVVESATDFAIFTMDLQRRISSWNSGAERLLGWSEQAALGQTADVIFTPEDREADVPEQEASAAVEQGRAEDIRWHVRQDGSRLWANGLVLPLRDDAGTIQGLLKILRDQTESKRVEEALRASEAQLQVEREFLNTLIRQAPIGISIAEAPSGRVLFLNDVAKKLIGHGDLGNDADRYRVYGAVHPDGRSYAVEDYPTVRAFRHGEVVHAEEMIYRHGGLADQGGAPTRRLEVSSAPVRDEAGKIVAAVTTLQDVEEQRRAAEQLRQSNARLQALMDQSSAGIVQTTPSGRFLFVNDRYCDFVGRSREELLSLKMQALTHPEDLPSNLHQFENLAQGGSSFEIVKRYLRPDGSTVWVRNSVAAVREPDGKVTSMFAVSLDISEQKRAAMREAFLLGLADRLRAEDTPSGVMATAADLVGVHLGASRVGYGLVQPDDQTIVLESGYASGVAPLSGTYALTSYDEDSITAQRQGKTVIADDTRALRTSERWAAIDTGSFISVPLIRDGSFKASLYVNHPGPHPWSADEVTLVQEVAARTWDAVERTQAETALREANDTLEQRIATALGEREKMEETLRQSQKMEAVGQLTGGLAHDFNNLLAGISGSLELMQIRLRQGRVNDLERYITVAQGSSKRAAALTHRLLAFSRRQTLDPKPTNVNTLVSGMQDLIQRTVGPAIPVEVVGASGLWTALVDPSQLENALLNLCINARDAMPDGGRITVETANKWLDERGARQQNMPEGQYLSMCVTDTGTGIAPDIVERVFEPFFTTKPIGEGTGLGLSMIYGFAKQSGGQVRIYTEVGKGTTVCIYLPRHYGEAQEENPDVKPAALDLAEQVATVLVVDDEPAVRMLVTDILEDLGYTAIEAGDSATGLKILQSNARIDLLVTDVGLPGGMNGRQMADAARVRRPELKVLFITGYAENAVVGNGHLAPGMAVLTKPFPIETMTARIRSMIDTK